MNSTFLANLHTLDISTGVRPLIERIYKELMYTDYIINNAASYFAVSYKDMQLFKIMPYASNITIIYNPKYLGLIGYDATTTGDELYGRQLYAKVVLSNQDYLDARDILSS